jgi:alkyldihydroxyacetonephosphate synthase
MTGAADSLRRDTRWWGWGDPDEPTSLPAGARRLLEGRGIETAPGGGRPELDRVRLPEPAKLPDPVIEAAGRVNVSTTHEDRVRHSGGQSYLDLIERRSGEIAFAPDAVIAIGDPSRILPLLQACAAEGVAVIPFGGGTSVVGGVTPRETGFDRVVSLDTTGLRGCRVDPVSLTATLGAGLRGPEAEALLADRGFTLGHFPQSFEYATIGGFAATRSAGQASSGYGRFDSLVSAISITSPAGEMSTIATPHTAIGPSLRELIVGSEGAFGVIPEVTVRIRPKPSSRRYEAWMVEDFDSGCEIVRRLAQNDVLPTIARVSDATETEVSLGTSVPEGAAGELFRGYLRLRGRSEGSLLIVGLEGSAVSTRRQRTELNRTLRSGGAVALGRSAGSGWEKGRFHGPYLREALLDHGLVVETFETAQQWSRHGDFYRSVRAAVTAQLAAEGMDAVVMCHLSHAYRDGASLYFTVIASPGKAGGPAGWRSVKNAAATAIRSGGGTLSHHHATGRDHVPWVDDEIGGLGVETLRAVKATLDPAGIMNPGCLLPLGPA